MKCRIRKDDIAVYTNPLIDQMLDRRSYREFTDRKVEEEKIQVLLEVARHTATSIGLQWASLIRINDPRKKEALADIGHQDYIARAPEVWIFLADGYRNARIAEEKGTPSPYAFDINFFAQAITDAALMAQNVMVALESMGLGGVFLGSILNDPDRLVEVLDLPQGTFPVVGMLFGYPNQNPQKKPRMDMSLRTFLDRYEDRSPYLETLADYDEEMQTYYDLRDANRRVDSFTDQVVKKIGSMNPDRNRLTRVAKSQGFRLYEDGLDFPPTAD
ncbi:NADPH-dependent oxidoreductase [Kallipyga gabonensis]|uniref:NADPH-dependent oxidoreductase n=1 Tax=Kallipyga gabonensis TaxID=1686287 RepID=UPI0012B8F8F4|nr:NADPH-dependent oxidoreductase [Kallipyga gabonensis]